jgi:hypothetical protein
MESIIIENISNYSIQFKENKLILIPNNIQVYEPEIYDHITKCNIQSCKISDIKITKLKFNTILSDIWNTMSQFEIGKYSSYKFKRKEELIEEKDIINYKNYQDHIKMYYCNKSGSDTFREIINMVKLKNLNMNIMIKKDNQIIEFNI